VTYSGQYLSSPLSGEIAVEAELIKPGRSAACANVRLTQNGRIALQAQVWTTGRDSGPEHLDLPRPNVPPPAALPPFENYMPADFAPHPFWAHFEGRPVRFIREDERDERGAVRESWYRLNDFMPTEDAFLDCARCVLLIDTLPWPTYASNQVPRPTFIAPTLDLTVWFHEPPRFCDWLFLDSYAPAAKQGLIHGGARVWSEDGRLLASGGSQLLVVEGR
jgi:acyl-CoA thioesterase